jgi:hypothetical protein
MITPSPDLTWISDDLLGQKTPFSLFKFPISPKHEAESLTGLRRHLTASDTLPQTPTAPPRSMLPGSFPTNFDWASPDAQSPESSESLDKLDIIDVNAYTPAAVVSEHVRETGGIFAPTPGILLSPLLDAPDSRGTPEGWPIERERARYK